MNKYMYHISGTGVISLVLNGETYNLQTDFPTYTLIRAAINRKDWDALPALVDVKSGVSSMSGGKLEITDDGVVKYDGDELHNAMSKRLITLWEGGYPIDSFFKFVENVMQNSSKNAVDELYLFLTENDIPITEDGCILCYKKVDNQFRSIHASPDGTYLDNTLGKTVTMPRNQVDEDRNNTCSYGLHCCSQTYLPHYGNSDSNRIVVVKVHPKNVVAVPSDYANAKMRVSEYDVVAEHKLGPATSAFNAPVYTADGSSANTINANCVSTIAQITNLVERYFKLKRKVSILDKRESFLSYGLSKKDLSDLAWEIEIEFDLDIVDLDYISVYSPIQALICFYENRVLKKNLNME